MIFRSILSVIIILLLQSCEFESKNSEKLIKISATGDGHVNAKPDIIEFQFTIREINKNITQTIDEVNRKSNEAIEILQKNLIDIKDIKTINYSAYPKFEYPKPICQNNICQKQEKTLIGYEVYQTYKIKLRDFAKISDILSQLAKININEIGNLSFGIDNLSEIKAKARSIAIANAKKDAQIIANDLNVKILKIIDFKENDNFNYQHQNISPMIARSYAKSSENSSIMSGQDSIKSSVTLTFKVE